MCTLIFQITTEFCFICQSVVLVAQLCLTLCNPMNCNLTGSSVHGILQVRILEWVAISSSRESSQPRSPALQADSLPTEPQVKPNIRTEALFQHQSIYMLSKVVFSWFKVLQHFFWKTLKFLKYVAGTFTATSDYLKIVFCPPTQRNLKKHWALCKIMWSNNKEL